MGSDQGTPDDAGNSPAQRRSDTAAPDVDAGREAKRIERRARAIRRLKDAPGAIRQYFDPRGLFSD